MEQYASQTTAGIPAPTLRECAQVLAALDRDRAREHNGIGYSAFDGDFGHWLASTDEAAWSPRARHGAWKMLRKYRKQLASAGLDFERIPEPPKPEPKPAVGAPQAKAAATPQPAGAGTLDLSEDGRHFLIRAPYSPERVQAARQLPGRTWAKPHAGADNVPATFETAAAVMAFAEAWGLTATDRAGQRIAELRIEGIRRASEQAQLREASKAAEADFFVPGLGVELYPFQRAGVAYATRTKRTFIADQMGLGKTVQALATLLAEAAFPALVVGPASLKLNWQREAKRALPGKRIQVLNGSVPREGYRHADVIIVNYDVLGRHAAGLRALGLKAIVLDESHYIKNEKAERSIAAICLGIGAEYLPKAERPREWKAKADPEHAPPIRLCLSGTPLTNRPAELPSQLRFLGRLGEFGGKWKFLQRYAGATHNRFGWDTTGAANLEELNQILRGSCYIRRTKDQVLTELPPKQRSSIPLSIDNRAEYERAEAELIKYVADRAAADAEFRASIAHLDAEEQRRAIHHRRMDAAEKAAAAEVLVRIATLKRLAATGKLAQAIEWIRDFLDNSDEKLVVFAHHKEVVRAVAGAFPGTPTITGETPIPARQAAVDQFQTDPGTRLIVLNLQAGGVGLTLTAARSVAFLELGWNPAIHDQAEDRCHRIGQRDSVTAYYLLAERTIEEEIGTLIEGKRNTVDLATDGKLDESVQNRSIMADLMKNLAARSGLLGQELDAEAYAEADAA